MSVGHLQEVVRVLVDVSLLDRAPPILGKRLDMVEQFGHFGRPIISASLENVLDLVVVVCGRNVLKVVVIVAAVFDLSKRRPGIGNRFDLKKL